MELKQPRQPSLFKKRRAFKTESFIYPEKIDSSFPISLTLGLYKNFLSAHYSLFTVKAFISDIRALARTIKDKKIGEITTDDLNFFLSSLKEKEQSQKTISRRTTALKNYFNWLSKQKIISYNPAEKIIYRRPVASLPQILFEAEQKNLLEQASLNSRTYLLILLLLEAGLKKDELLNLEVKDIDISNQFRPEVWIRSKNPRKERRLKLPAEFTATYQNYLKEFRIREKLFEMSDRNLTYILSDLRRRARIKKKITCQVLRDTFAVNQLKRGESIETVFKKLGLAPTSWNQETKEKYLKLSSPAL